MEELNLQEGSIVLAIVGSRTFTGTIDEETTDFILKYGKPSLIVSGGARGVDTLAKLFAKMHQIPFKEFLPDWKKDGKRAGLLRNTDIVKACTHMIAFPDKNGGKGTRDSIMKAKELKKVMKVIEF